MEKKYPVSVCIVAFNEEKIIGRCLDSVAWADDIVVLDSFSEDATFEICRKFTPRVFKREWEGYRNQKKHAISLAKNDWVLLMDADEVLTDELIREIKDELDAGDSRFDGYYLSRRLRYLGSWIMRGEWYPEYKIRLFKKSKTEIGGMEPHDTMTVQSGKTKRLRGDMLHYSYDNISDQMNTLNKYSSIAAEEMFEKGVRFPFARMIFHPAWRFVQAYFMRKGFMDGIPGFVIAVVNSFYVFLKYAKLWELYLDKRQSSSCGRGPAG